MSGRSRLKQLESQKSAAEVPTPPEGGRDEHLGKEGAIGGFSRANGDRQETRVAVRGLTWEATRE